MASHEEYYPQCSAYSTTYLQACIGYSAKDRKLEQSTTQPRQEPYVESLAETGTL